MTSWRRKEAKDLHFLQPKLLERGDCGGRDVLKETTEKLVQLSEDYYSSLTQSLSTCVSLR